MAILTALDPAEITEACAAFGVEVRDHEGVLAGSVNTNYAIDGRDGARRFLRVYEEQDQAGAERETALVSALADSGVPTPAPLPRLDGQGCVVLVRSKPAALYPFVPGTIRCQKSVSPADTHAVGAALARVHLAGRSLDPALGLTRPSRFGPEAIGSRLASIRARPLPEHVDGPEVLAATERLERALDDLGSAAISAGELPLIHGDLFRDNVLFHPAGLALLDFESASTGLASFDLAVTALAFTFGDGLGAELIRSLAAGYRSERPIDPAEAADLPRAARLACVRFATTRLTDYELRPRGLGVYKDFRRWMARLDVVSDAAAPFAALFSA